MSFISDNQNPLADLVELKSKLSSPDEMDDRRHLVVELRIQPDEIEEERLGTFTVAIEEALLAVDFYGLEVVPRTRHGQDDPGGKTTRSVEREITETSTTQAGKCGGFEASVGASAAGPIGKLGLNRSSSTNDGETLVAREKESFSKNHHPVKAMSNDRWRITMPDRVPLDAAFLDDNSLCQVTAVRGANRLAVVSRVSVKQKHLILNLERNTSIIPRSLSNNQTKLMKILVAKSLHEGQKTDKYAGEIVFSRSTISDEG